MKNKLLLLTAVAILSAYACNRKPKTTDEPEEKCTVQHQDWTRSAVIYEVNIRQYTKEGTFAAFETHLPRLKDLGVDILSLMPVNPIAEKDKNGMLGSYYAVGNYNEVNPAFGSKDDFKKLVGKAHEMGFKVMLQWNASSTGKGHVWMTEHPDWYQKGSSGNVQESKDRDSLSKLDYSNQELQAAMTEVMKYWLTEFNLDGFFCNEAHEVPVSYWNVLRKELESVKPVFMAAGSGDNTLLSNAFDANYSIDLSQLLENMNKGKSNAEDITAYIHRLDTMIIDTMLCLDAYKINYLTNGVQNAFSGTEYDRYGKMTELFAVLTYTLNGMPMLYTGQEVGMKKKLSFYDKDMVPSWKENATTKFYKKLNELKRTHPSLRAGQMGGTIRKYSATDGDKLLIFSRERAGKELMVMLNFSNKSITYSSNDALSRNNYTDFFSGKKIGMLPKTLKPYEYRVLTRE
ncbi:MAG: alpha-amylase [Prevotella sp.]|jgi:glycosidase|nr:alpha-amylase [Prevotella sp.]